MKIKHYVILVIAGLTIVASSCKKSSDANVVNPYYNEVSKPSNEQSAEFLLAWWEQLFSFVASERLSPPDASRMYAYIATAIYEAQLPGNPDYLTFEGQLNGLEDLPRPNKNEVYDWTAVTIETIYYVQDEMLARYLPAGVKAINDLHAKQAEECAKTVSADVMERSKKYGRELADAIIAWSESDGYEASRYMQFKAPAREGKPEFWEPTDFNQTALEPFWGTHRTFAVEDPKQCDINLKFAFSLDTASQMYKECLEVYMVDKNLTEEQRIVSQYWADDPGETATPPGHWMGIVGNFVESEKMNLSQASELYALTAISMQDACITLWGTKYRVNLVRPKTLINELFEKGWEPYVETPPFPGYTSGHSGFSGAASEILTALIGDDKPFIDSAHVKIGLLPRNFTSFRDAAEEAAYSRMYGGIHYTCEIQDGLVQGQCTAKHALNELKINAKRQNLNGNKGNSEEMAEKAEDVETEM